MTSPVFVPNTGAPTHAGRFRQPVVALAAVSTTGIQRRGAAVVTESATGGTSFIATMPTGLVDGDVIWADITVAAPSSITHPSGWTQAAATGAAGGVIKWAAYHVVTSAAGEPSTYTWIGLTAGRITVIAQNYLGVDNTTPIDVTASTATASTGPTLAAASITTVTDGAMLVSGGGQDSSVSPTLVTPPSSMPLVGRWTLAVGKAGASADEPDSTAGPTGARTWLFDSSALGHVVYLAALRPASGVAVGAAPAPLVVTPPFAPIPVPGAQISASQPLGNPAVGSPQPLVVSTAWTAQVPGAILSSNPATPVVPSATSPQPLVVSPPHQPAPLLAARISSSQPLGNPAVGTPSPYVVTTTWAAKVLGAQLFVNPAAPVVSATSTPNALVVTPAPGVVLVPGARLLAGSPNTASARPLVVSMPFVRLPAPGARIVSNPLVPPAQRTFAPVLVVTTPWVSDRGGVFFSRGTEPGAAVSCQLPRPSSGTTVRPGAGTTARPVSTTLRPGSGVTLRPDTGNTDNPC